MSLVKWRAVLLLGLITALGVMACGGADESVSEPTAPPPTTAPLASATPEATQPPAEPTRPPAEQEEPTATTEQMTATREEVPTEPAEEPETDIPHDVPIMEGATDLQTLPGTGSISYVVQDTGIEEVIEFYRTSMAELGWENITSSEVGLMATLVFESETLRMSASLQANNIANTVTVRLNVLEQ